jgi:NAD(P)-dependent dehydrogenase (short-subunit alcohol dehydrogenase family)
MASYVVTGGGRGVGRAIVERLLHDGGTVVTMEFDESALDWVGTHPARERVVAMVADASDEDATTHAAEQAQARAPLAGWVNNAAVFRDAALHSASPATVVDLIGRNLNPAVAGCAAAVRAFHAAGNGGAIVNVSSHQAQRPVPGCLPYATAKAAIEGLTRAVAVDYGEFGIRANTVALGTIAVERYEQSIAGDDGARIAAETARLHALGRVGRTSEVAATVAYLLSDEASFLSGATIPVDGGRSVLAREPQP